MRTSNFRFHILAVLALGGLCSPTRAAPLKVCTTTPDLASLVREVGGDEVRVTTFAKGSEDAHFIEARPSFVRELSTADLYIQTGLELEMGWAPVLLRGARNADVQPGAAGYLDASRAIKPRDVPTGQVDRSQGDVHPLGNPHYLLDPINGLKVARLIRDKLTALRPARKGYFEERYGDFRGRLSALLIGEKLASTYDVEKLMLLHDHGRLEAFLKQQGQLELLGGWVGRMRPLEGAAVVADHNMWSYFAARFGLEVIGYMEPRPGLSPTTRHLGDLVRTMRQRSVKLVIASPYFPDRHAAFLAEHTGARSVVLAHQVQSIDGADDYLSMFEHNVAALEAALRDPGNGGRR